ncbi:MAG: hypothetical protein IBX56_03400 [Methylomicrobium sp.]|nr:hypothetical protein [Methylomicrobium sp.]
MPVWKEKSRETINDIEIVVNERKDQRNHHGAVEYVIEAYKDGEIVLTERCSWNKWLGHCHGQLLKPLIADRAISRFSE